MSAIDPFCKKLLLVALLAGDAFGIGSPASPLVLFWNGRAAAVFQKFQFLVPIVNDFQIKHPAKLTDALGIAFPRRCSGA